MNILLVEDEATKADKIILCVEESVLNTFITTVKSVRSAIDMLHEKRFDLIILDMSLPTFDISEDENGGRPQGFGGKEVMREMQNYDFFTPVIIVTAYEEFSSNNDVDKKKEITFQEVKDDLGSEFEDIYVEMIKYETSFDDWRHKLISALDIVKKEL